MIFALCGYVTENESTDEAPNETQSLRLIRHPADNASLRIEDSPHV